ncbi:MAG: DNA starvation/stationary phase protection protein Dps [Burkholderiaceae bacterium]
MPAAQPAARRLHRPADAVKQAHWNVKGADFIALHKLFDDINEAVEDHVDLLAERVVQLGGVAEGTLRGAAQRSTLDLYPSSISDAVQHIEAQAGALASFGRSTRRGIDEMDGLNDAVSADILTQIARGTDQWLWFVEAHVPPQPAAPPASEEPKLAFEPDIPPERSPATQDA